MGLSFIWPVMLWVLLLVPSLIVFYRRLLVRPAAVPVVWPTAPAARQAMDARTPVRRHLAAVCFAAALVVIIMAIARPVTPLPVPADRSAIMLALDVSGSMRSQDMLPSRLAAAQSAAKDFVRALPARVHLGLVVFAGFASVLAPPTTEHSRIVDLIDGVSTARRTAIGEGLIEAVAALPERIRPTPGSPIPSKPPGVRPPGIVVLLSDGRSNAGIDPLEAAAIARQQDVTVYTVGVGQREASFNSWTIGGSLDEETMQAIAAATGGTYYHAGTAEGLRQIYTRLARRVGWERRPVEVTGAAAGLAAVLALAAVVLSRRLTFLLDG
ncbi:MAG TPA: VWA domain-containing protein [bacterium]|jgi:Ca-activated chloride channel family protein